YFSRKMGLYPQDIRFRKAKRRLGSCSYDNILTFNYLAIKLDKKEIDYIVVHELAHIKEKNHSKRFWSIVEKEFPNYKEIRKGINLSL
ncbi:MAG: M48 family metallopeptidase, partial [Epsilonproteobacteria bacterium]|nr:M48 family metallopeptidase [Campylobacterota bacterium]